MYKRYNYYGSRDDEIPGSTRRYWNTKNRIKQSTACAAPSGENACKKDVHRSEVLHDDIAKCFSLGFESSNNEPGDAETNTVHPTTSEARGTPIINDVLVAECDDADPQIDDGIQLSSGQNPTQTAESLMPFHPINVRVEILLILATKLRHNLTYVATEDIAELVGVMTKSTLSQITKYQLKKMIDGFSSQIEIHHLCPKCKSHLGVSGGDTIYCDSCDTNIDVKSNIKSHNIFIYMSLNKQLVELFETTDAHQNLFIEKRKKTCSYAIEDIFDGKLYKEKVRHPDISINFNVDGVPVSNSSNTSIWPILCSVNELHPIQRRSNVLLCGIWFGSGKPKMHEYLKPFVAESKKLESDGFTYQCKDRTHNRKCRVLICISDSVARPLLRNSNQFNGEYGCGFCLHAGETIEKGKGFVRVYPLDEDDRPFGEGLRTHENTIEHAVNREKGMKGPSMLREIPGFDIVQSLDVDWMHCVSLGVCRQFCKLWFDTANHSKNFYFGHVLDSMDNLLQSFRPDSGISRTPRRMSDRAHWKAHEWVTFLLFYSLPILRALFPQTFVHHWALLVDGISVLLKTSIMPSEIEYSRQCIIKFVAGVENLYGREYISFNVHLLTHLPQSVSNWGPLWSHSAFLYENTNQYLLKSVQSSNGISLQICDTFRVRNCVARLLEDCNETLTESQAAYLNNILMKTPKIRTTLIVNDTISMLGSPMNVNELPRDQYLALQRLNVSIDEDSTIQLYNRAMVNREIFHSKMYSKVKKRANYYALLYTHEVFEIDLFLIVKVNNILECFAIGRYFERNTQPFIRNTRLDHLIVLDKCFDNLAAVNTSLLKEKITLIIMDDPKILLACVHPNHYELLI